MQSLGNEITEYGKKLDLVKAKATEAVTNKNFSSGAAKDAITIYSENYVKRVKDGNMVQNLQKKMKENQGIKSIQSMKALPKSLGKTL